MDDQLPNMMRQSHNNCGRQGLKLSGGFESELRQAAEKCTDLRNAKARAKENERLLLQLGETTRRIPILSNSREPGGAE